MLWAVLSEARQSGARGRRVRRLTAELMNTEWVGSDCGLGATAGRRRGRGSPLPLNISQSQLLIVLFTELQSRSNAIV